MEIDKWTQPLTCETANRAPWRCEPILYGTASRQKCEAETLELNVVSPPLLSDLRRSVRRVRRARKAEGHAIDVCQSLYHLRICSMEGLFDVVQMKTAWTIVCNELLACVFWVCGHFEIRLEHAARLVHVMTTQ